MTSRRDVLKMMGALGGTLLTSCGVSTPRPTGGSPIPSGYRFLALKDSGAALPSGGTLRRFRLDAAINAKGHVYYGAFDDTSPKSRLGLYRLDLEISGDDARVMGEQRVVRQGDVLAGNRTVRQLGNYASNTSGHLAMIVRPTQGPNAIYLDRGAGLQTLLEAKRVTADGHRLDGVFGDLDLHDNDDLLFVERYAHTLEGNRQEPRQGLFFSPGGDPAKTRLLESTGRFLPGGGAVSRSFGLVDLHDGGAYVAQVFAGPPRRDSVQALSVAPASVALVGNTAQAGNTALVAADRRLGFRPQGLSDAQLGEVTAGPRIGAGALTTTLLHLTDEACVLLYGPQKVLETGERAPSGYAVTAISPGVLAPGGLLYFVVTTRQGEELCVFNGEETRTVLATGDRIGTDLRPIQGITCGHMPDAAHPNGCVVLFAQYGDGSAQLVVALPR